MIVLLGFGSESVFAYTVRQFQDVRSVVVVDIEEIIYSDFTVFCDGQSSLVIEGRKSYRIPNDVPLYHRFFPRREPNSEVQSRLNVLYREFVAFCVDRKPGTLLINHPLASSLNSSKPAQIELLRSLGFETPATLLSIRNSDVRKFCERFERPISKGASGIRTRAERVDIHDLNLVGDHQSVPVLLQEYIEGYDVRLHCIGLARVALKIETEFVDYRYAEKNGYEIRTSIVMAPPDIVDKCWDYMCLEKQEFAAFDFRVRNGDWYLLEVNPMPGYSFFDKLCEGKISNALLSLLKQGYSNLYRPRIDAPLVSLERRPKVDIGKPRAE